MTTHSTPRYGDYQTRCGHPSAGTTGQREGHAQLAPGEYPCQTALGQDWIPSALAAYVITHYTRPGAVVLDPDCGAGTVLVEALRAGRHAIGLTTHRRDGELARANFTTAPRADAWPEGMVLEDTPTTQTDCTDHLTGLTGRVDLLLTTLRHHALSLAYTEPPAPDSLGTLTRALVRCRPLLHPGGHVVITLAPPRLTLTRRIMAAGHAAGLLAIDRYLALLTEPHSIRIITRASLAQRRAAARCQRLTARHDVLVFRIPDSTEQVANGLTTTVAGLDAHQLGRDTPTHRPAATSSTPCRQAA